MDKSSTVKGSGDCLISPSVPLFSTVGDASDNDCIDILNCQDNGNTSSDEENTDYERNERPPRSRSRTHSRSGSFCEVRPAEPFLLPKTALLKPDRSGIDITVLRQHLARQGRVTAEAAVFLLRRATLLLRAEPNVLDLKAPIAVFGDLHGQFYDLLHALDLVGGPGAKEDRSRRNKLRSSSYSSSTNDIPVVPPPPISHSGRSSMASLPIVGEIKDNTEPSCAAAAATIPPAPPEKRILFLGDYVDRGYFSLELLLFISALKVQYPTSVFMLRGNHETRVMTEFMTFKDECWAKYHDIAVYEAAMDFCDALPIAAHITGCEAGNVLAVHGGIAPDLCTIQQLNEIDRFCEPETETPLNDLLWADPLEPPVLRAPPKYSFDEDATDDDDDDDELSVRPYSDEDTEDTDSCDDDDVEEQDETFEEDNECCESQDSKQFENDGDSASNSSSGSGISSSGSVSDNCPRSDDENTDYSNHEEEEEEEEEDPKIAEEIREWQSIDYVENDQRKTSFKFGYAAIEKFLETNNLVTLVRAHQVVSEGAKEHFFMSRNDFPLVVTVFSAPNYCDMYGNKGAVMLITDDDFEYVQFDAVPHPYCLPNFANVLSYALPHMMHSFIEILSSLIEAAAQSESNAESTEAGDKSSTSTTSSPEQPQPPQQPQRVLPVDSKADLSVDKSLLPKEPNSFLSSAGESSQQKFQKTLEDDAENEQCPVFGPKLPPVTRPSSSSSSSSSSPPSSPPVTATTETVTVQP